MPSLIRVYHFSIIREVAVERRQMWILGVAYKTEYTSHFDRVVMHISRLEKSSRGLCPSDQAEDAYEIHCL